MDYNSRMISKVWKSKLIGKYIIWLSIPPLFMIIENYVRSNRVCWRESMDLTWVKCLSIETDPTQVSYQWIEVILDPFWESSSSSDHDILNFTK